MKSLIALAAAVLVLGACHYEFAAVKPNDLPLDPKLAGRWIQAEAPAEGEFRHELVVAPSRQGGAFLDLKVEKDGHWYFRAHSLGKDLAGLYQLEFLGASSGERPEETPFTIASVALEGENLAWRLIDPEKVGEVKDGGALLQRIREAARKGEQLFTPRQLYTPDR